MKEKAVFNWSGGKDSAYGLYKVLQEGKYEIVCLLTTISATYRRISMHGVIESLLEAQAESIGIPLQKIYLPEEASMENYEKLMEVALGALKMKNVSISAYGDIFLEDLRVYREKKLAGTGIKGIFPLWKIPTQQLIFDFIGAGFKTIVTCVNEKYLDRSFAGRIIDHDFLSDLPPGVDPCGENGEFHTFVFDGPLFKRPVRFRKGEIICRKYPPAVRNSSSETDNVFWYCNLEDKTY